MLRWAGRIWTGVLLVTVLLSVLLLGLRVALPLFAAPPVLVATSPAAGDARVAPRAAAVLRFDTPMHPSSVERALRFDPPLAATYRWNADFTTLTISPTAALRPDTTYSIGVGQGALNRFFRALAAPTSLTFRTAAALSVMATLPADGARDVPLDAAISLSFSHAVVPTATLALPTGLPQLRFEPPISGTVTWLDPALALLRPSALLQPGTRYTATLDAGLADQTGARLDSPVVWSFSTPAPTVLATAPANLTQAVAPTAPLVIRLSQPFDPAALQASLTISPSIALLASAATLPDATQIVTFTPAASWQPDTTYTAALHDGALPAVGNMPLERGTTWRFRTAPQPQVIGRFPGEGQTLPLGQEIRLIFNTPVDDDSLRASVRFVPEAANLRVTTEGSEARIAADLQAATTYTMTLAPSLRDQNGLELAQPYQLRFVTPPAAPALQIARADDHILRLPPGSSELVLTRTNLSALDAELFQLDEATVVRVADFRSDEWAQFSPTRSNQRLIRAWSQPTADPLNTPTPARLPLRDADQQPLPPGAYYLRIRTPEGPRADLLLLHSRVQLTWQQGRTGALVWASDVISGTPVGNLPLALYRQGALVLRGSTDAAGMWRVTPPGSIQQPLIVVADGALTSSGQQSGQLAVPAPLPQLLVTTDRSTYAPGDRVALAGFARSVAGRALALPPPGTRVELSIRPATSAARVYKESIVISSTGVLSGAFMLPNDAAAGDYLATARLGDQSVSARFAVQGAAALLNVQVSTPAQVSAGDAVAAQVTVQTPERLPVAGATISWTLQAEGVPPPPLDGYSVGDVAQPSALQTLRSGTAQTDDAGRLTMPISETAALTAAPIRYQLLITASEPGSTADASASFVAQPAAVQVGVQLPSRVSSAGQSQNVQLLTVAQDGTSAPATPVRMALFRQPRAPEDQPVLTRAATTDAAGRAVLPLALPNGGAYQLVATATDAAGRESRSTTPLWVAAPGFTAWNEPPQLIPDKAVYQPGDIATLLPTMPFEAATALIAVQHGTTLTGDTRLLRAGELISVPLALTDSAPVAVSVQFLEQRATPDDTTPAATASAALLLPISASEQTLSVTLTADRETYAPQATALLTVTTTDASGQGVPADVILALASDAAPPSTAYWNPALRTDERGLLTLRLPLPDAPGTLHATAWAARRDLLRLNASGFAQAQQTVAVTRPLALDLTLPDQLCIGDQFDLTAYVQNTSTVTQNARVVLTATGLGIRNLAPLTQQIALAPGQRAPVRWPVTVNDAAGASLSVSAQADAGTPISITQNRPIKTASEIIEAERSTLLESGAAPLRLAAPPNARLAIEAAPSMLALAHSTLAMQAAQPPGSVLDDAGLLLMSATLSHTDALAAPVLERLLAAQKLDGSWAWWRNGPADRVVTLQTLEALAAARRIGLPVPEDAVARGISAARLMMGDASPTLHAYAQYVYALHQRGDAVERNRLATSPQAFGNEGVAYLLLAGVPGDARDVLLERLRAQAQRDATGAYWLADSAADLWSTHVSATALAARALRQDRASDALLPSAQAWLRSARGVGGWGDSVSNARALAALLTEDAGARGRATLTLNDSPLLLFDGSMPITTTQRVTLLADRLREQNTLAVSGGPLFLSYRLSRPGLPPVQQQPTGLLREYLDPQTGARLAPGTLRVGQLVRVRLTFVTNRALRFVTLTDTLPSGMRLVATGSGDWERVVVADGQLRATRTALPPGIHEQSYLARAVVPGVFAAPPARVAQLDTDLNLGRRDVITIGTAR